MRWIFLILLVLNISLFAWFEQEQGLRDRVAHRSELVGVDVVSLRMLAEIPLKLRERGSSGVSSETVRIDTISRSGCFEVTGFKSEQAAQRFVDRSLPEGISGTAVAAISQDKEYWVYIKSPKEVQQRRALQSELREAGLEVSLIKRGELKGELSLGHYLNRDLAEALYEALVAQKYPVEIFEIVLKSAGYGVHIVSSDPLSEGLSTLSDLLRSRSDLKIEKKVCKGVASNGVPE